MGSIRSHAAQVKPSIRSVLLIEQRSGVYKSAVCWKMKFELIIQGEQGEHL
jgi:hypothetical protein